MPRKKKSSHAQIMDRLTTDGFYEKLGELADSWFADVELRTFCLALGSQRTYELVFREQKIMHDIVKRKDIPDPNELGLEAILEQCTIFFRLHTLFCLKNDDSDYKNWLAHWKAIFDVLLKVHQGKDDSVTAEQVYDKLQQSEPKKEHRFKKEFDTLKSLSGELVFKMLPAYLQFLGGRKLERKLPKKEENYINTIYPTKT